MMGKLWDAVYADSACWANTYHNIESYNEAQYMYKAASNADYSLMHYFIYDKPNIPKRAIKAWQKWKAFYHDGTAMTKQEMRIRLMLARRIEAIKKMDADDGE